VPVQFNNRLRPPDAVLDHTYMPTIDAGVGRITLRSNGSEAVFSELSYAYPLKLLSPRLAQENVAVVYILSYGGGLVGGDRVKLAVNIEQSSVLVVLSQGSTKVFKARPGQRRAQAISDTTSQYMTVNVSPNSALFLLPDPVTCFRSAKYDQRQVFRISGSSSAVLLDWITSGRKSLGEEWVFDRYYSLNELWVDGKRVARDATLLEDPAAGIADHYDNAKLTRQLGSLPPRTLADRLKPYSCYATVIMYGPLVASTIQHLSKEYDALVVHKCVKPQDALWSFSTVCDGQGCVLRVAAKETEDVRNWLGRELKTLEGVIGLDIYRKAFGY